MPDWNQLVRQRLARIELNEEETSDVVEELAGHLEESYRNFLSRGATDQEASLMSLEEVSNWQRLRAEIESSKKKVPAMNERVSQFWFPAFVTLSLSMVLLMVIQLWGPDLPASDPLAAGSSHWRFVAPVLVVYGSWLVMLPFIGALGAWLSRRAGAGAKTVFLVIAFPVFPFLAFLIIGLPMALILDDHVAHNITLPAFLVGSSAWIIFPAIALLAGGFPVQYFWTRRPPARNVAGPC